jgi:hypothetical protein
MPGYAWYEDRSAAARLGGVSPGGCTTNLAFALLGAVLGKKGNKQKSIKETR